MAIYRGEGGELYSLGIPQWGAITGDIELQLDLKAKFEAVNEAISLKASVASVSAIESVLATKQNTLVSGTNIKTINGDSLLGSGNLSILAGASWGTITGTLSDQTDLQTALNNKLNASAVSVFGLTLIDGADATEARGTLELGTAATADSGDFATVAQGTLADTALQPATIGVTVQGYDANTTKNNVSNSFTQPNEFIKTFTDWTAEAFNATQTLNASVPAGTTTLTGNMTLNAVSNSTTGEMQVIVRAFTQDATGGRTLAYNTAVFSASGASFPQPASTANRVSLFQFTKMPDGKWAVQSLNDVRST